MASSLYQLLSPHELSDIVGSLLQTEVIWARPLTGGLFNTTYLVETASMGKVVLRIGPVNRHLLMPFEHRLMEAEETVYSLCRGHGISCSEILALDRTKSRIDRDIMIVRYLPSRPMSEVSLSDADRARICFAIGKEVQKMHGISSERFGRIPEVTDGGGFVRWSDCLKNELAQWERVAAPTELYSGEERAQIHRIFDRFAPLLDEIRQPCLVHNDLWEGNLLLKDTESGPEFAAVIDVDRAIWGDAELEFSAMQWMYGDDAFWAGYGRRLSCAPAAVRRREVYCLLCCLWDSYVYINEYNQPDQAMILRKIAIDHIAALS